MKDKMLRDMLKKISGKVFESRTAKRPFQQFTDEEYEELSRIISDVYEENFREQRSRAELESSK